MVRLKENHSATKFDAAAVFQFQMVRLKARKLFYRLLIVEFQFQMVRLKGKKSGKALRQATCFNSKWFD